MTTAGIINTAVGTGNINANLTNGPALSVNLGPNQPYSGIAIDAAAGTGFDVVDILIIGDVLTTTTTKGSSVDCVVPANLGTFTIPTAALAYLPASGTWQVEITAAPSQGGATSAESSTATALTPPLVAGGQINFGAFTAYIAYIVTAKVQ